MLLACAAFLQAVSATTYYVKNGGSDAADGLSDATAWATVAKVATEANASRFLPGDNILFKRGSLWRETLNVPTVTVGVLAGRIVFGAYGSGADPRLSGANVVGGWTLSASGTNTYQAPLATQTYMVTRQPTGSDIIFMHKGASATTLTDNQWFWSGGVLYVRSDAGNPAGIGTTIEAAQRNSCVTTSGANGADYITIENFDLGQTNSGVIVIDGGATYWKVLNCRIRFCESRTVAGAGIHASCANFIARDNIIDYALGDGILLYGGLDSIIQGNHITNIRKGNNPGGDGIQLTSDTPNAVNGFQILDNYVNVQNTDAGKGCIIQEAGGNGIVSGNQCYYGNFGIEVNGDNIVVENNICAFVGVEQNPSFAAGLFMSQKANCDNVTWRNNLVYKCKRNGISIDATNSNGVGVVTSPPYLRTNMKFYNNTVIDCEDGFSVVSTCQISGEFKNNLLWTTPANFIIEIPSVLPGGTWVSDHNLIGSPSPNPDRFIRYGGNWLSVTHRPGTNVKLSDVSSTVASTSSKRFILLRIDFNTAGNTVYMWVDPVLTSEPAIATAHATKTWAYNYRIGNVAAYFSSTSFNSGYFDEFRIGNTYTDAIGGSPLVYEGFNYPDNSIIDGVTGGTGWAEAWDANEDYTSVNGTTSFTFPGVAGTGGRLQIRGSASRAMATPIVQSSGTKWAGYFIQSDNTARDTVVSIGERDTKFDNLAQWRAASGQDLNSISAAPLFVNAATDNYHPAAGSPVIDAGVIVGSSLDSEGLLVPYGPAPDIGNYEFGSTPPPVVPGDTLPSGLIAYEGFDHPTNTLLSGLSGGSTYSSVGWSDAWTVQASVSTYSSIQNAWNYSGLESRGNRARIRGLASRNLSVPLAASEGTFWFATLLNCSNEARNSSFRLKQNGATKISVDVKPGTQIKLSGVGTGVTASNNTIYLALVRVDMHESGNIARVWINPSLAAGEPLASTANATAEWDENWGIDQVEIYHSSTSSHESNFDEIRIGRTFSNAISGTILQTPWELWLSGAGFTPAEIQAGMAEPGADAADDGVPNLVKFALGHDSPRTALPAALYPKANISTGGVFSISFVRAEASVRYEVEASSGLTGWSVIAVNPGTVGQTVTTPDTVAPGQVSRFLRLRVSMP